MIIDRRAFVAARRSLHSRQPLSSCQYHFLRL